MAKYVDLSSVINGDGSISTPWCGPQVGNSLVLANITEDIFIKGSASLADFTVGQTGLVQITNWIPTEPFRVHVETPGTMILGVFGSPRVTIKNAILSCNSDSFVVYDTTFESCILYYYSEPLSNPDNVIAKGCTFIGLDLYVTTGILTDCIVIGGNSGTGTANNCVFTSVWGGSGSNNQNNWTPPSWPAWNAAQSAFSSLLLSVGINTPPQPGTPPYTDYATGLWGSPRTGIGGMDFEAAPATWSDYIPVEGDAVYDKSQDLILTFDGSEWVTSTVDGKVLTSASDPAPGYLIAKLEAGIAMAIGEDTSDPASYKAKLDVQFGTLSDQACAGDDSRLSDDRFPTAHRTTHLQSGTDPFILNGTGAPPSAAGLPDGTLYVKYTP